MELLAGTGELMYRTPEHCWLTCKPTDTESALSDAQKHFTLAANVR
jgi:hypothetical protein